jgi:phosphinothricin acetyltransferase
VQIRPACEDDLAPLNEIYNYYVRETYITFDIEPITMEQRRAWFDHYDVAGRHRLLVAVDDAVVGYASSVRGTRDRRTRRRSRRASISPRRRPDGDVAVYEKPLS